MRKFTVVCCLAAVSLIANIWLITRWLDENGVIDFARHIKAEYLTGTAITIIVVLLILLTTPRRVRAVATRTRHCPVCDGKLPTSANYCGECGSRV